MLTHFWVYCFFASIWLIYNSSFKSNWRTKKTICLKNSKKILFLKKVKNIPFWPARGGVVVVVVVVLGRVKGPLLHTLAVWSNQGKLFKITSQFAKHIRKRALDSRHTRQKILLKDILMIFSHIISLHAFSALHSRLLKYNLVPFTF